MTRASDKMPSSSMGEYEKTNLRKNHLSCFKKWKETNRHGNVWLRWSGGFRSGSREEERSQKMYDKIQYPWDGKEYVTFQKLGGKLKEHRVQAMRGVILPNFTLEWHLPWEGSAHQVLLCENFLCILKEEQIIIAHISILFPTYSCWFFPIYFIFPFFLINNLNNILKMESTLNINIYHHIQCHEYQYPTV